MAARVGPDQSVNNPSVIQALLGKIRYLADVYAAMKDASDTEDFDLSELINPGTNSMQAFPSNQLLSVFMPLRLANGTSEKYSSDYAIGATLSSAFNNQLDDNAPAAGIENSTINTYVNLAEFFRSYWGQINQFPLLLSPYTATGNSQTIDPAGTINTSCSVAANGLKTETELIRAADSTSFDTEEVSFFYITGGSFVPRSTPDWIGSGPASYFDTTYPQLRDELNTLFPQVNIDITTGQITDYLYLVTKRTSGVPAPTGTGEAKELYLQSSFSVSIYNPSTTTSQSVNVNCNNSCTHGNLIFAPGTGRGCELFCQARISLFDKDGNFISTTDNSSTVLVEAPPPPATNSGSNSESTTVNIPPLGRAVCRVQSRVRQQTPTVGVSQPFGSGAATIVVNGVSLSRTADFGFFGTPCPP